LDGKRIKHVFNSIGHYNEVPRTITLPPGEYLVRAETKNRMRVDVPVVIEQGRTTRVHLEAHWEPPTEITKAELVSLPDGFPVGWRAEPFKGVGMN
jgi:hypothetical protein